MLRREQIETFLAESNRIERIFHVKAGETEAAEAFLGLPQIMPENLLTYVKATVADPFLAALRNKVGMDVSVGFHVSPPGGPEIEKRLTRLLSLTNARAMPAHKAHLIYEHLHPFLDGNGRSGRLLWLWQMGGTGTGSFLHDWYYQSLQHYDQSPAPSGFQRPDPKVLKALSVESTP